MDDVELICDVRNGDGHLGTLIVRPEGQVSVNDDPQGGLCAYSVTLTLPPDQGRERVVVKRVIHYAPHGWRRLLMKAVESVT